MGLLDAISGLQKLAEDPDLAKSATALGNAAAAIPTVLTEIRDLLKTQVLTAGDDILERAKWYSLFSEQMTTISNRLTEISLGLDTLADPVKRPPFSQTDVEAMMKGAWPPPGINEVNDPSQLADDLHDLMKAK